MLINLISNALRYTDKGSIKIKADYDTTTQLLTVQVIDTGNGIAKKDIRSIFTRFGIMRRQVNRDLDDENVLDLGLTVVRGIAKHCNGKFYLHSDGVGKGSTFTFSMQDTEQVVESAKDEQILEKINDAPAAPYAREEMVPVHFS